MSDDQTADWGTVAGWLAGLDQNKKVSVLARVAHELTILARDTYEPGTRGVSDPSRLRAINEVMHRLTRRVLNLSRGSGDDWNEAEFWQALAELSEQGGCFNDLVAATSTASDGRVG